MAEKNLSQKNFEEAKKRFLSFRGKGYEYVPDAIDKMNKSDFVLSESIEIKVYKFDIKARVCGNRYDGDIKYTKEFLVEYSIYITDNEMYADSKNIYYSSNPTKYEDYIEFAKDAAEELYKNNFIDLGFWYDKAYINHVQQSQPEVVDTIDVYEANMKYLYKGKEKTQPIKIFVMNEIDDIKVGKLLCEGQDKRNKIKHLLIVGAGLIIFILILVGYYFDNFR
ncbi:MAG: hypothetical protein ACI4MV_05185 [Christensenellales bacterium]